MSGRLLAADGRAVVVAIDHGLYTWPVAGLERRRELIADVVAAGADAVIAGYGTVRDCRAAFGDARVVLKLDVTVLSVDDYRPAPWAVAYTVDDALRLGADAVMTLIELGTDGEIEALRAAGAVAAAADRAGLAYVCEILPTASPAFPDPFASSAVAGAARTAAELGAHVVKTSIPTPPEAIAEAVACDVPIVLAGGAPADDAETYVAGLGRAVAAGAAGVAVGRNVWGARDPAAMVRRLAAIVHG
jgi:DhnA family fructose-bisphosphate aldolase class Ia